MARLFAVHEEGVIMRTRPWLSCLSVALGLLAVPVTLGAQDLEPKAYSASPTGAVFLVAGFSRSTGSVVFDPSLPVTDVEAKVNGAMLAGGYSFGLAGKLALVTAAVPYGWGVISGKVNEDAQSITRSGLTDSRVKLSVNLVGNPAMGARAFAKAPRKTIVGTSLTVVTPAGQYYPARLINLGTNRWAFKPEVGVAVPLGRWDLDAYLGVWLFTDNQDFYPGGKSRSQDPVVSLQGHLSYTFKPRLWAAFDATWYRGGAAAVEGGTPGTGMNNSRLGATVSFPVARYQSLKVALSRGVIVRTGTNFTALSVGYQWLWFTKK
jgi:hypothetical protein